MDKLKKEDRENIQKSKTPEHYAGMMNPDEEIEKKMSIKEALWFMMTFYVLTEVQRLMSVLLGEVRKI